MSQNSTLELARLWSVLMPKPNACVMAMVDAIMDRGSMLCEGGAEKKKN